MVQIFKLQLIRGTDFGRNMLFNIGGVKFGVEICEDMWVPAAPSLHQAVDGAQILFNLSASPEVLGKHNYLLTLHRPLYGRHARRHCGDVEIPRRRPL